MDKYVKFAIIIGTLLAGIGIFYHFVIFLPRIEHQKYERVEAEKREAMLKELARKIEYDNCKLSARRDYEANWKTACESLARDGLTNDSSPDCSLPNIRANPINRSHKEAEDRCLSEARSGL